MRTLAAPFLLLSSLVVGAGCVGDEVDDVDLAADALRSCDGWHKSSDKHKGHHHKRHHHHGGGSGGAGMGGSGMGGMGGSGTGGRGGSGPGGMGGTVDPRCNPLSGTISWWHADGDFDDAVGSNDGSSPGIVTFTPGVNGTAFSLGSSPGSFVEIPNAADLQVSSAITIDAWINTPSTGGRIVDKITAGSGDGYLLDMVGDRLRMLIGSPGVFSLNPVAPGTFTHVAGTYDGTKIALYVNGVPAGDVAISGTIPVNSLPLRIGADSTGGSLLSGQVDEPRIFGRALSPAEIQSIYWQGTNCE